VNSPLDVKQNDEHAIDFTLHLSHRSQSQRIWILLFRHLYMTEAFFPEHLSDQCQGRHHTFSEICTKLICTLLNPLQNSIRPHTRLQLKCRKKSAHSSSCVKFCKVTIYHCIALLQLLYRWQHHSGKLWLAVVRITVVWGVTQFRVKILGREIKKQILFLYSCFHIWFTHHGSSRFPRSIHTLL
jgi:hypothetical protein